MKSIMKWASWLVLAAPLTAVNAETVLTTSAWGPPNHPVFSTIAKWAEQLNEQTSGRLKLRILPTPPVSAGDTIRAVQGGVQDLGIIVHGYTPGRFKLTGLAELPFGGHSAETTSVAYQRVHERYLSAADEHRGLEVLSVFVHGPGQILNTKQAVTSVDDLRRLKWRVGGGIAHQVAELMDVTAFLKPAPESYELLSSGIADGLFFPVEGVVSYRLDELIDHVTIVPGGLYNVSWALIMNKKRFDQLSKEDQEALKAATGERFSRLVGRAWDIGDVNGAAMLQKSGTEFVTADAGFVAELQKVLAPVEANWIKTATEQGVDAQAALASFRAELDSLDAEQSTKTP